jgi:hypothetical protein
MKNFKEKIWTVVLVLLIAIPALLGILAVFGVLSNVFSTISNVFVALSGGSWLRGIVYTLFVIVGLTNLIRGVFTFSPHEEDFFARLPDWAKTLIVALSLIGTVGFIIVFFNLLMEK